MVHQGWVSSSSLGLVNPPFTRGGDLRFARRCKRRGRLRGRKRCLFLANYQAEITILGSLHPWMPKKSVMIRAIAFGWVVDVGDRNKPVRGKLLYQLDDIAARNVELFREMIEGGPGVTLTSPRNTSGERKAS